MSHYIESRCVYHGEYSYDSDHPTGCPECFTLEEAMTYLYSYELNSSVSCHWDGGFDVRLGDDMNGFKSETSFDSEELYKAGNWLVAEAKKFYPTIEWKDKP